MITIKEAKVDDVDEIIDLFESTVKAVNKKDYSPEQIAVWTSAKDQNIWSEKVKSQNFYLAKIGNEIVGFSSIDNSGYLDFMYVHKDFQGHGIAKSLLNQIELKARELELTKIHSSVSSTAQPFFKSQGFEVYDQEHKNINDIAFTNALMQKVL
ncbi:putative acetyltransferase [Ekhidna lutea]|uniref:Putative acetyltransferase n=1 Tax=Ekhidna lutea TaxID=447679 RepID=A0A239LLR9_EKHLU|nr:GNAT family N-acetyltransferase [Ekhidna lutea]SNT30763.1 putative acetyltransferase [Ekhidna lutea]